MKLIFDDVPESVQGKILALTTCEECDAAIDPTLGEFTPDGGGRAGTPDDPRAPGDTDVICENCDYGA